MMTKLKVVVHRYLMDKLMDTWLKGGASVTPSGSSTNANLTKPT